MKQFTKEELAKEGVITFEHTDNYGIYYILQIYETGLMCIVRVYNKSKDLLFHNETSFTDFEKAKNMYEESKKTILNEAASIHRRFANKCIVEYDKVKKQKDYLRSRPNLKRIYS